MSDLDDRLARLRHGAAPSLVPVQDVQARGDQRRRTGRIVSAAAAVLLVTGTGGIVYGLSDPGGGRDDALTPAARPTASVPVPGPSSAPSATPSPTATPRPSPSRTPSATRSAPPSPTVSPAPTGLDGDDRLELTGIGGLRIGQTYAQAEAATGVKISVSDDIGGGGGCVSGDLAGRDDLGILGGDGVVQRIDVVSGAVTTSSGVGIGDTEAHIRKVYTSAEERPSVYNPNGSWFVVHPAGSPYELVFETDGNVVTTFRTGTVGFVEAPEGCA